MKSDARGRLLAACMAVVLCAVGAWAAADEAGEAAHLLESEYESAIKGALRQYYTDDRIQITGITVDVDGAPHDGAVDDTESAEEMASRLEAEYSAAALKALAAVIPADRVRVANVRVSVAREAAEGDSPFDHYIVVDHMPPCIFSSTIEDRLTEAGASSSDASATYSGITILEEGELERTGPLRVSRVQLSVVADGQWLYPLYDLDANDRLHLSLNEDGGYRRQYVPLTDEELDDLTRLVRAAVGYDASRGDEVVVTSAPFDRTEQFAAEDAAFRRSRRLKAVLLFAAAFVCVLAAVTAVLLWRRKRSPARAAGKS